MVDVDDVNAYFDAQESQSANIANLSIAAAGRTPEEAAKDFNTAHTFAKVTGNPVPPIPVVRDYRPDFESKISEFERLNALTASPRLASWLSHPENSDRAPIVADDLKNLGFWEGLGKSSYEGVRAVPGGVISGTGNAMEGVGRLFAPDYEAPTAPVTPTDAGYLERAWNWALGVRAQAIQDSEQKRQNLVKAGKSLTETGRATLPPSPGYEDSYSVMIGHTLGALIPMLGMGAATGGTGALATGVAQVAGFGAEDARAHGADEKTQNESALWNAPFGALDLAPVMRLLRMPAARQGVMEIAKSVATQFALQGGTGAIQTVAANEVAKTLYDPNRATLDGVADSAGVGGATGVITDLVRLGLGAIVRRRISVPEARAETANANRQVLEGITQAAAGSVTRGRSADVFRDIVSHGVDGTPAQDIFVPADKFVEYFQSVGQNPYELARGLAGINDGDLQAAIQSDTDLRIPIATYAADMAGMGHDEFFLDNARFSPDEMTFSEAREFNERKDDLRQEAWDEAESQRLADESERSTEQAIYDEAVSRLRVAGRATDVATTEAALYPSFYSARAAHEGMDPAELLAAYPLPEFQGDLPQGMQLKDVDELNRTLAAARNRKEVADTRPSLLDFIHDHGGMTDHGGELKSRDALTVKQGKGKRTLKLARKSEKAATGDMLGGKSEEGRKHGPDAVAQAAIEAGYLLDHPDVKEWIAATHEGREAPDITRALYDGIDEELRGNKIFATEETEALKQAKHLAEVEEYLGSLGLSLKDSDEHIRAGLEEAEKRRYAQSFAADMRALISSAKSAIKGVTEKLRIGPVSSDVAQVIKDHTGLDVSGYEHDIDTNAIQHIFKRHGDERKELSRGQLPVTDADIEAIPSIVHSADAIVTGAKNARGQEIVGYIKRMPNDTTLYLEEVRTGRKTMSAASMRKYPSDVENEKIAKTVDDGKSSAAKSSDNADLASTSETSPSEIRLTDLSKNRNDGATFFQKMGGARGSIQFPAKGVGSGVTVIRAFEGANLSTVAHETGHYFLAVTEDMAAKGFKGASADMEALGKWWGENAADVAADGNKALPDARLTADDVRAALETGTTGDPIKDAAIQVGKHEQFARGFEHYLMEGRAPSLDLRSAFEKFRSWMISIYRNLTGLGVRMSPDVTAVFDRMLASDAQIEEARANSGEAGPVFATAEQMGLTQEQFDRFMKNRQQAQDDAKAKLLKEALAPIKRERDEAYKAEKAAVTQEVTREVNKLPMYRAIDWIINRRWYGDEDGGHQEVDDIRFDKETLVERYGPGILETLPSGKRKAYTTDGGADPDDIAGLFGFDSGDELVRAMERAPDKKQAIADQVELRMREKHGDMLTDGTAEAQALAAVHNDKKGDYLSAELRAVVEVTGRGDTLTAKQAKASARAATSRMRVRDAADSRRYLAAERKAGEEAAKLGAQLARNKVYLDQARNKIEVTARKAAKGEATGEQVAAAIDAHNAKQETTTSTYTHAKTGKEVTTVNKGYNDLVDAYVDAKRRQLINHALYSESVKIAKEVERAERLVKRLGSKTTRDKIAGAGRRENAQVDYLAALDDVMSRYDFSAMTTGAEAKRNALNDFITAMTAAGRENELAIPDDVLQRAGQAPYKTIPVEELRGAVDTLKNIEHMALRWNKLIDAQRERSLSETVEGVVKAIDENLPKNEPGRVATSKEERRKGVRQFLNLSLNLNALSHRIDGGEHGGAFFEAIKKPIDEAVNRLTVRKVATAKKVKQAFSRYSKKEMRSMNVRKVIPELGGLSLSKLEILVIALNTGNADNLQRLTDRTLLKSGGSFTLDQVRAVLNNHLDARDADFVQSVFNIHEENRQAIGERERRTTGKEPKWVEPTPTTIGGKEIPGGYYPIMYDSRLSSRELDEDFLAQNVTGGQYSKAQTRNGHLKARAESSGRPLSLDIGRWGNALNQADYDLDLSEAVTNVGRVLNHPDVKAAFQSSGNQPYLETVTDWLRDVGSGELHGSDIVSKGSRLFKKNFTMAALGFNVSTAMAQAAGLAPAFNHLGAKHFAIGVRDSMRPAMRGGVEGKSPMMAARRAAGADIDISDFLKSSKRGAVGEAYNTGMRAVERGAFWLLGHAQYHLVDVPNWLGGYSKGLELYGNDEAKAIAFADDAVKRSQGSENFHDKSAMQRGTTDRNKHQDSFIKLFGALSSFMATKYNAIDMTLTESKRSMADGSNSAVYLAKGAQLAASLLMLTVADVVAGAAIKKSARWVLNGGQGEDESKDESWTEYLAKETAFATLGNLPFFRDMSGGFQGYGDGGAYGSIMSGIVRGGTGFWNVATSEFTGRKIKNSDWTSIISGIGTISGLPSVALNRFVDAELRYLQGGKVTVADVLMGKNHR
jgi:hypothetical protein